jgi:hypothetical protein
MGGSLRERGSHVTDEQAPGQPDVEQVTVPFRPRGSYAGYRAFGGGDGAVLVEPGLARQLRFAAELATGERRCTGGLLFGRRWADDQGAYLVLSGFTETGPDEDGGEGAGDVDSAAGGGDFTLSAAALRLMREDAARTYPAGYEVGWWRTLTALGEFGPADLATQAELAGPGGVGLLVYGSGIHWGTAYLGPDGHAPDSAGTLVIAAEPVAGPPAGPGPALEADVAAGPEAVPELRPELGPEPGPEAVDMAAGERQPRQPGRTRQRVSSRVRVPSRARVRAARPVDAGYPDQAYPDDGYPSRELPADYQLVVVALAVAFVAAAIIVGFLVHSFVVAVIIAVVGLLAIGATVWMSHYH